MSRDHAIDDDFAAVPAGFVQPWTVWAWRDAVVAVLVWDEDQDRHLLAQARQSGEPLVVFEADGAQPMPRVGDAVAVGWVEVCRLVPTGGRPAVERHAA